MSDGGTAPLAASPITNRWGEVTLQPLEVEHVAVFDGVDGAAFNHQAQLAWDGARLYATWSSCARDEEGSGQQMLLAVSDDVGRSWSAPRIAAPARPGRHAPTVVVSSGILVAGRDRLLAWYGEWQRWEAGRKGPREAAGEIRFDVHTEARLSTDRGETWSEPLVTLADRAGFMPPVRTRSGRLLLPGHVTCHYTDDPDGLAGWRRATLPGLPADHVDDWYGSGRGAELLGIPCRFNEANVYQTDNGTLRMMMRNERQSLLGAAESLDDGRSWSMPKLTRFTNSVSRSHFGRLPDGRYFCVNCPGPPPTGVAPSTRTPRTPLVLALGNDGDHFDRHYAIGVEPQGTPRIDGYLKHGRYGYPYLEVAGDTALVVYSVNKEDIRVARFVLPA